MGLVSFLRALAVVSCLAAAVELWSPGAGDWLSAIKKVEDGQLLHGPVKLIYAAAVLLLICSC